MIARALLLVVCALLALPVVAVLASWFSLDAAGLDGLAHQARTVLAGYVGQSLVLAVGVGVGVALVGGAAAAAVSLLDFPGRRVFEWALLLPMAMPAYVLAYAYTDVLQTSGPLQHTLREAFGWQGALWPDVRSLPGAIVLFVLCLYPYVYLLTRAALGDRAVQLMEAARLLGAGTPRRVRAVALPLARPALAAGVALALMETLADYGVGAYFGLATLSTGIYKAWIVLGDRIAAAQLASMLLLLVALLLWLERRAQSRARYALSRSGAGHAADARLLALSRGGAFAAASLCALPVMLGFVVPVVSLVVMLWDQAQHADVGLPLARFVQWSATSLQLAVAAATLAVALALALAAAQRARADGWLNAGVRLVSLGYAVPGAVIAVGILLPVGLVQARWPSAGVGAWFTGTVLGILAAYLVRFTAVAWQSVQAGYARVPTSLDDTARLLGAGPGRVLRELHLPLLSRSVAVAGLLVFVDVMKELPATLVLRPFNTDTLAVVAYNLARDERLAEAALPSLAIVLVGLGPVLLLARAWRRGEAAL